MIKPWPASDGVRPLLSEVYDDAALIIEQDGWTQGTARDEQGCVCMYGAIQLAYQNGPHWVTVRHFLAIHLGVGGVPGLIDWNDKPGRTKAEVIQALRDAAESARRGE